MAGFGPDRRSANAILNYASMMNQFQIRRVALLVRLDIFSNARHYQGVALGMFLLHFFSLFLVFHNTSPADLLSASGREELVESAAANFVCLSLLVGAYAFSLPLSRLSTRTLRTAYLLVPASCIEKFVSRLLVCGLGLFVLNILAFALADAVRMLLFWESTADLGSLLPVVWDAERGLPMLFFGISNGHFWHYSNLFFALALFFSCFVLGSALFRRFAFIYTYLVIIGVSMLFGWLSLTPHSLSIGMHIYTDNVYLAWGILSLLSALFVWAAFRLFCKLPVVRRKWF